MNPWLRFALTGALFAATFFLLGFFHRYHLPRIEQWLLLKIEKPTID